MTSTFTFRLLSDDCKLNVVSYLSIEERVRCERVDKQFRDVLNQQWTSQRVLCAVGSFKRHSLSCPSYTGSNCSNKLHKFYSKTDVYVNKGSNLLRNFGTVLKRCPNLKALYWQGTCPAQLGEMINRDCPKLEHFSVDSGFEDIAGLTAIESCSLTCVMLENGYHGEADEPLAKFLEKCTSLVRFRVHELVETSPQVTEVVLRKNFLELDTGIVWIAKEMDILIPSITTKSTNIQKLRIDYVLNSEQLDLLCKSLTHLETFDIRMDSSDMSPLVQLTKLKKLCWQTYHNHRRPSCDLSKVFKANSKLKSLSFFTPDVTLGDVVPCLVAHCPFVESLIVTVDRRPAPAFDPAPLAGLTRLRRLRLQFMGPDTFHILEQVLIKCKKLNYINLIGRKFRITNEIMNNITDYAECHPKRRIDLEIMEHRADCALFKPIPVNLKVIDDKGRDIIFKWQSFNAVISGAVDSLMKQLV
ncbi:hypothetical protein HDE_12754 [Halotydeus destructor]|nr:hypothetical protein HDE_12754 [Halotydeus destructor]